MKSNKVGRNLKHLETINGNVKNISKMILTLYFTNLTLPLIAIIASFRS